MPGSSSTHLSLAFSSCFFNVDSRVLLVASACPLLWGYLGVEYRFLILSSEQKVLKVALSNCGLLSATIVWGIPNRHTIFFQMNFVTSLSLMRTVKNGGLGEIMLDFLECILATWCPPRLVGFSEL